MRPAPRRLCTLSATAVAAAALLATTPAFAAPTTAAAAKPPVSLTLPATPVLESGITTFTVALHLPSWDGVDSWTLTYGDGKTSTGYGAVPHTITHTYHKTLQHKATLTVHDYRGLALTGSTEVTVGALGGRVLSGTKPVKGVAVSIDDDDTDDTYAVVHTDAKGYWTAPGTMSTPYSKGGYDIEVNLDEHANGNGASNSKYDVEELDGLQPGAKAIKSELPPTALITGFVTAVGGGPAGKGTIIVGCSQANGSICGLEAVGTVDPADGSYSIHLGAGKSWTLVALNVASDSLSEGKASLKVGDVKPKAGPTLTLVSVGDSSSGGSPFPNARLFH